MVACLLPLFFLPFRWLFFLSLSFRFFSFRISISKKKIHFICLFHFFECLFSSVVLCLSRVFRVSFFFLSLFLFFLFSLSLSLSFYLSLKKMYISVPIFGICLASFERFFVLFLFFIFICLICVCVFFLLRYNGFVIRLLIFDGSKRRFRFALSSNDLFCRIWTAWGVQIRIVSRLCGSLNSVDSLFFSCSFLVFNFCIPAVDQVMHFPSIFDGCSDEFVRMLFFDASICRDGKGEAFPLHIFPLLL